MKSEIRTCSECGKEFQPKSGNTKCCSILCSHERHLRLKRELHLIRKTKKEITNADKIAIMNNEALEHGMSYGQYVAKKEYPIKIVRKEVQNETN